MSLNTYASNFVVPIRDGLKFASSNTTPEINPDTSIKCGVDEGVTRAELQTMITNGEDVTQVCTSNITDFSMMFYLADAFNQNISGWKVDNATDWTNFKTNSPLTDENTPTKFR